ncbi:MAG: tRNA preQ1(34) S-adenosylmethionine ribosyltransferase-isomerase QueA [Hyphomicrobium sp.]|nr:tRNA preQ1(34) S-adenosylmethionine ribosyltransferase-isomerase QueA [Hyphomicrobium sp.]
MRTELFDFDLPEERIALHPISPRDAARLLIVPAGGAPFEDRGVRDLPDLLRAGDALVFNDTRVIPAALAGVRRRGELEAHIAVTLIERLGPARWRALARPAKRLHEGGPPAVRSFRQRVPCRRARCHRRRARRKWRGGHRLRPFRVRARCRHRRRGEMPLPPYIAGRRAVEAADRTDYQTVFAARDGAVAAPTAGLHFTPELMATLQARGISRHFVTLHVGAGTFLPVKAEDTGGHKMHAETGEVSAATAAALNAVRARGGRIVAVGTTSLRLLETAARDGEIRPFHGATDIFITPGYGFRAVDVLMTNFHLPRSTLFMLVAAFAGLERMKAAYAHAIAAGYRFYSYGDACLLFPSVVPAEGE